MKKLTIIALVLCWITGNAQNKELTPKRAGLILMDSVKIDHNVNLSILNIFNSATGANSNHSVLKSTKKVPPVMFFIDSMKVSDWLINFLDPAEIATINTSNEKQYNALYIKLKNHSSFLELINGKTFTLGDIAKIYLNSDDLHKPVLYLLNDKLLTDTANISIPSPCLGDVTVIKASETPYFKTALPDVLIIMITLKAWPAKTDSHTIYLRGKRDEIGSLN